MLSTIRLKQSKLEVFPGSFEASSESKNIAKKYCSLVETECKNASFSL